jgi:hypothetical protein
MWCPRTPPLPPPQHVLAAKAAKCAEEATEALLRYVDAATESMFANQDLFRLNASVMQPEAKQRKAEDELLLAISDALLDISDEVMTDEEHPQKRTANTLLAICDKGMTGEGHPQQPAWQNTDDDSDDPMTGQGHPQQPAPQDKDNSGSGWEDDLWSGWGDDLWSGWEDGSWTGREDDWWSGWAQTVPTSSDNRMTGEASTSASSGYNNSAPAWTGTSLTIRWAKRARETQS